MTFHCDESGNATPVLRTKGLIAAAVLLLCVFVLTLLTVAWCLYLRAVFKYGRGAHNVVAVNAAGYKSCSAARGGRTYNSGSDRDTLARGTNYFICSVPGHCQAGMKMAVTAA